MRILVTGGAGFVGSTFVRRVLYGAYADLRDAQVTVIDKLTYCGNLANLHPVVRHPRFRFLRGDICDARRVGEAITGHDMVVHFAAETHVDRSIDDGRRFITTNVLGTQVLLDAARQHGVARFVHVSTDEVYGSIEAGSWSEAYGVRPNSPYSAAKASSDLLVLAHHRTYGLPVMVTRCSNNYGPYQFPEKVIPFFITNLLNGLTVPLYGDGRHVRDWLHVDDHCQGVAQVLIGGRPGEIYNIGGGTELDNKELTSRLLVACDATWDQVEYVADRKGHDRWYSLDHGKIGRELGYRPSVSFEEGLAQTVEWYRRNRSWWEPLRKRMRRSSAGATAGCRSSRW